MINYWLVHQSCLFSFVYLFDSELIDRKRVSFDSTRCINASLLSLSSRQLLRRYQDPSLSIQIVC
jgi:hypothetical protein